jgi:hypothetical protein
MFIFVVLVPILFFSSSSDFFKLADQQIEQGAKWHYVGKKNLSPSAKSLPLQCIDPETEEPCSEPFVLWKLKNGDE